MTVPSTTARWEYAGDGATTVFPYTNLIFATTDLRVYLDGVLQLLTTHFTVSGAGEPTGGNVTFLTAPPAASEIVIARRVANTQETDYVEGDAFPAAAHEAALDRRTIVAQGHDDALARALTAPESEPLIDMTLPTVAEREGKYLIFATGGQPAPAAAPAGTTTLSAFGASFGQAADAGAARGILGILGRNLLINGAFRVWQRGTTFTGPLGGPFTADRWAASDSDGTASVTRQAIPSADWDDVQFASRFAYQYALTVLPTTGQCQPATQAIEDVATLAGRTVTLSFFARLAAGTDPLLTIQAQQSFGTGGAPSAPVAVGFLTAATLGLSATWQRFAFSATLPSIAGKTLGTDDNHTLVVKFLTAAVPAATFTLQLTGVQLEEGDEATPFEPVPIADELARCRRYFHRANLTGNQTLTAGQAQTTTVFRSYELPLPSPMRVAPTATISNVKDGSSNGWQVIEDDGGTTNNMSAVNVGLATDNLGHFRLTLTRTSGTWTIGEAGNIKTVTGVNQTIDFDAEL